MTVPGSSESGGRAESVGATSRLAEAEAAARSLLVEWTKRGLGDPDLLLRRVFHGRTPDPRDSGLPKHPNAYDTATAWAMHLINARCLDGVEHPLAALLREAYSTQQAPDCDFPGGYDGLLAYLDALCCPKCIVSVRRTADRQGLLCLGLHLGRQLILTFKDPLAGHEQGATLYVASADGSGSALKARVRQLHGELNAAVLELATPGESIPEARPALGLSEVALQSPEANLWTVPLGSTLVRANRVGVTAGADPNADTIAVDVEEASRTGGILEENGRVLGLLPPCEPGEPTPRAVSMHRLLPWIESTLRPPASLSMSLEPEPEPRPTVPSDVYRGLVEDVRARIRELLQGQEMKTIRERWGADPLKNFDIPAAARENDRLWTEIVQVTEDCADQWRDLPESVRHEISHRCRSIVTNLAMLAVDPDAPDGAGQCMVRKREGSGPGKIHVRCQEPFVADLVYAAGNDVPCQLSLASREGGQESQNEFSVHFRGEIADGVGRDRLFTLARKLWTRFPRLGAVPDVIADKDLDKVRRAIVNERRRKREYWMVEKGRFEDLFGPTFEKMVDEIGVGLALYEGTPCPDQLVDELLLDDFLKMYIGILEEILK